MEPVLLVLCLLRRWSIYWSDPGIEIQEFHLFVELALSEFIYLFFVEYGEEGGEEERTIVETNVLTSYQLGGMLCFLIFMDNLLRWMERGGDSAWFWLCSGKLEVVFLFGLFSLLAQFLYWSEI